jgi:PAS domain S-box-containing protein
MRRFPFKTAGWLTALALLGFLYWKSNQVDGALHVRTVAHFEQLREQDARLNQYVLQSRYGLLRNYDPLVTTRQKIVQLLDALQQDQPLYFGAGDGPIAKEFRHYRTLFDDKFELVEGFKSHNAVLRNSMHYFPLAVNQLMNSSAAQQRRDHLLHDLLESVLLYDNQSGTQLQPHIEQVMTELLQLDSRPNPDMASVAQHVKLILGFEAEVNQYTKDITQSQSTAEGNALFALYGQNFSARQQSADRYRLALALLSATMLAYVAWTLNALQRARKTLTDSLRELEFQKYALDAHSIVSIADRGGKILATNPKFSEVSQYRPDELLGQDHRVLNSGHHSHEFFKSMWATIGHGQVWHGEVKNRRKDGSFYWVDSTIVPFLDDKGKVMRYVSIRTDITERKKADQAMLEAKETAEAALRIKSDFLANMSHEIRTPMNGIIGMTNLTLETDLNAEQREYVGLVKSSADSLLQIINDILDFSKIESGKMTMELIEFSLEVMLRDTMKTLALRAHQKKLELLLHVAPDVPDRIKGDPGRIRQVIVNLVGNAIKFTSKGEVEVSVTRQEGAPDGHTRLHFSVRDTGIGIPQDKQKSIFESFSQADTSTTRKYGGTGLGLSISAQLIALMGSHIELTSQVDQGSTFHFSLDMPTTSGKALAWYQKTGSIENMAVLVVDDNDTNRRLLTQMLTNWHMRPLAVANGELALAELARAAQADTPYALAVLDVQMPGMDGFELVQRMRGQAQTTTMTVMMLSSQGQRGDARRCRDLGVASYLSKPVSQSDLLDAIMTALGEPLQTETPLITQYSLQENRRPLNLLLAEDNAVNQKLAVTLLQKQGHQVTVANNGLEAISHWTSGEFDAILMDVDMPEMNGYEATEQIRLTEQGRAVHIPIVAMTAHAMQGAREECLAHGMDGYLSKPIDVAALWHELDLLLPRSEPAPSQTGASNAAAKSSTSASVADALPVANFHQLRQTIDNNRELFEELVKLYVTDAPVQRARLQVGLAQGDADAVRRAAHSIKGMVGVFSAERTLAAAQAVEDNTGRSDCTSVIAQLERTMDEFELTLTSYVW